MVSLEDMHYFVWWKKISLPQWTNLGSELYKSAKKMNVLSDKLFA